jgi:hypothetical protein
MHFLKELAPADITDAKQHELLAKRREQIMKQIAKL